MRTLTRRLARKLTRARARFAMWNHPEDWHPSNDRPGLVCVGCRGAFVPPIGCIDTTCEWHMPANVDAWLGVR